jgi:hypothetical protein
MDSFFDSLYRPDLIAAAIQGDKAGTLREAESKLRIGTILAGRHAAACRHRLAGSEQRQQRR